MNLDIAITTAPRNIPTLHACIESIRLAGWEYEINVFAESGQYMINVPGETVFHIHEEKKGCLFNYDHVLNWFINESDQDFLLTVQDDFIFCRNAFDIIDEVNKEKPFGYLALLTVAQHPTLKSYIKKVGWNQCKLGVEAWGAGYFMQRETIERVLKTDFYVQHLAGKTKKKEKHGKMIDGCISQCCKLLDLNMWYHNPSLVQHIGIDSTLNHNGYLTGLNFDLNYKPKT